MSGKGQFRMSGKGQRAQLRQHSIDCRLPVSPSFNKFRMSGKGRAAAGGYGSVAYNPFPLILNLLKDGKGL